MCIAPLGPAALQSGCAVTILYRAERVIKPKVGGATESLMVQCRSSGIKYVGVMLCWVKILNTIGIDHGQGVVSIMIHLSEIDVQEGDMVQAGQEIGAVGTTGASTGPHLHWGLYVNGRSVDPVLWRFEGFQ